nr:hypothetical protein [Tanacetum cinerariifolium]GEZ29121.1 hypothetical protein [Tanacetum cinerariifolium]
MALELVEEAKTKAAEEAKIDGKYSREPQSINTISFKEAKAEAQREQSSEAPLTTEPIPPVSFALIVQPLEGKASKERPSKDEPPIKRLKFLIPNPIIPSPTLLSSFSPQDFKQPVVVNMTMPLIEKGGSDPKTLNLRQFSISGRKMTLEEAQAELTEMKSSEILKEVFVKEDIVVDRTHRNLGPPPRVEGSKGLVIREPESEIFFYNGNFHLVFQKEEEFHVATIAQLIRTQSVIQRGTPEAEEMFKKIELTI